MSDDADKKARELADHCSYCEMPDWRPECRADYEDQVNAIAATLREKDDDYYALKKVTDADRTLFDAEIAELKSNNQLYYELEQAKAEIARLKGELEAAREETERVRSQSDYVLTKLDRQVVDLQVALEQAVGKPSVKK